MNLGLEGKVVLVTGSSKGLGFSIATALHKEGCHVIVNGRDQKSVDRAVASLGARATGVVADVTDSAACQMLVREIRQRCGRLDVLVCNVGSGASVAPGKESAPEWRRVFDINLAAATNTI